MKLVSILNLLQLKQIFQLFDDDGTERLSLEELRQANLVPLKLLPPASATLTTDTSAHFIRQNKQKQHRPQMLKLRSNFDNEYCRTTLV